MSAARTRFWPGAALALTLAGCGIAGAPLRPDDYRPPNVSWSDWGEEEAQGDRLDAILEAP